MQRLVHHLRVEVAGRPRRDRRGGHTHRPQPIRVALGLEVAGDRADAALAGESSRRRLEHRGLARSGRAHQVHGEDAVLREVLADVRRGASFTARILSCTSTETRFGVAAAAGVAHQGTSISICSRSISSPVTSFAGTSQPAQRSTAPLGIAACALRAGPRRLRAPDVQLASASNPCRTSVKAEANSSGSTPESGADAHRELVDRDRLARARLACARARPSPRPASTRASADHHSAIALSRSWAVARPRAARAAGGCRAGSSARAGRDRRRRPCRRAALPRRPAASGSPRAPPPPRPPGTIARKRPSQAT